MTATKSDPLQAFPWVPQPEADELLRAVVEGFLAANPAAAELAGRMREDTGTRFFDWIDTIILPDQGDIASRLARAGFVPDPLGQGAKGPALHHPGGLFPRVVVSSQPSAEVLLKVESVAEFLVANATWTGAAEIEGRPLAPLRRACVAKSPRTALWVVERHGYRGYALQDCDADTVERVLGHAEAFRLRQRDWATDEQGMDRLETLVQAVVKDLGVGRACDVFFAAEREYWQWRNRAAQAQKARQDRLGLGWANHDHHTYRSSRRNFARMIGLFELLGLVCRERFYAGKEAGWGAQVMEQPHAGIVVFADVDLAPDELRNDFAHGPLPPVSRLGTVGLWCGLHGESILQAGMHHLECQFDFESLARQLKEEEGVGTMPPFTDLPYLRQAFTDGERWAVEEKRLGELLSRGLITDEQAAEFRRHGAIGSHLENLERNQGFKGFNQKGVSQIIAATDPRKHVGGEAAEVRTGA